MKRNMDFDENYGETVSANLLACSDFGAETIPVWKIKGVLDAETIVEFLSSQRHNYGPMSEVEKNIYGQAIKDLAKLRTNPSILQNCRLDLIVPGDRTIYTRSFRSGKGQNRYVISADEKGHACEMYCTHQSFKERMSFFKLWPFAVILLMGTVMSLMVTGVVFKLKASPLTTRVDGVLHTRMVITGAAHDPYEDPNCDAFPKGKLY